MKTYSAEFKASMIKKLLPPHNADVVEVARETGQDFRPPPDWDQGFEFHGGGFTGADAEQFSDFFESLFGRGGYGSGYTRDARREFHALGEDTYAKVLIDLEDAYHGAEQVFELVEEGVIEPLGRDPAHWRFRGVSVRRVRRARRLEQDLGINLAGAALALDLLEELERLRVRLRRFES